MLDNPKVTVLMPVYNAENYVRQTIESILNQTFSDFEFLIINDGSSDRSVDIINEFSDSRIRLINNPGNIRLAATLNKGIELARGQYIARMDADDISLPERLEQQVTFMDQHPEVGCCGTNTCTINGSGELISPFGLEKSMVPIEWTLLWETPVPHPTVMLRKCILKENDLKYRDVHAEDIDLWCRLVLKTRMARLDKVLLLYRVYGSSQFSKNRTESISQAIISNTSLITTLTKKDIPDFYHKLNIYDKTKNIINKNQILEVSKWIQMLAKVCNQYWQWNPDEYEAAIDDSQKRLSQYLLDNPILLSINSCFLIWKMGNKEIKFWHIWFIIKAISIKFPFIGAVLADIIKPIKNIRNLLKEKLFSDV